MLSGKCNIERTQFFLVFAICLLVSNVAAAETPNRWHRIESRYAIINYTSAKDLKKFTKKIDYSAGEWRLKTLLNAAGSSVSTDAVVRKVDTLYERVQHILEMFGTLKKKVNINIYSNKKGLHRAYFDITRRQCNIRSWYIYERNTIFVNVKDVNEGMLAHEMAHAIIDHYLIVRPPNATAEILARYVDDHLRY